MDAPQQAEVFMLRVSEDDQLRHQLYSANSFEEISALASGHGYTFTAKEFEIFFTSTPSCQSLRARRGSGENNSFYNPETWDYHKDEKGDIVWADHRLNILSANLDTIYNLVYDVRMQAQIDLLKVQNNLNTQSSKDPTVEIIGWLASKAVEATALIFPAGTGTAVAVGLIARLLSGSIQAVTKDHSSAGYNEVQSEVNNTMNAMLALFDALLKGLSGMRKPEQMQAGWRQELHPLSADTSQLLKPITLSEVATYPDFFPKRGTDPDFDEARNVVSNQVKLLVTQHLLPVKYRIYELTSGPDTEHFFWNVEWYGTSSTSKWNEWRQREGFPAIPNDLRDSVEGPYEDIGGRTYIKGGYQYFQEFTNGMADERYVNYYWTRSPGQRWMNWGGAHCASGDAVAQGATCDKKTDKDGNIIQGTPFLDHFDRLVADYRTGGFFSTGYKSSLVWYKLGDESINNRSVSRMTTTNFCNDWRYEKNIFKWNWAYRGIRIRIYTLVDASGNYASDTLSEWLFKDDGAGEILNKDGIANRVDIYHNWGLKMY
jgi:predicted ribosomally synthesized peptide with nif11-like leader